MTKQIEGSPYEPIVDSMAELSLSDSIVPAEISAERRDRMRSNILSRIRQGAPEGTITIRYEQGSWLDVTSKIAIKMLQLDREAGRQSLLMRVQPGGYLPEHVHTQPEELYVLEGECRIGEQYSLFAGDVHFAAAGSRHERIATDAGVLLLIHCEYPTQIRW